MYHTLMAILIRQPGRYSRKTVIFQSNPGAEDGNEDIFKGGVYREVCMSHV